MIIDGRAMAQDILGKVHAAVDAFDAPLMMRAITVSPTPATQSYLKAKARAAETAGIQFEVIEFADDATTEDVIEAVQRPGANAVIVQLPLPSSIDTETVLVAIPANADADALSPAARASGVPVPPVAAAVEEILLQSGVTVAGKSAIVIGTGRLVGEPVARRLAALGTHVRSYDITTFTSDVLRDADIIVSGAGSPHMVTLDMVKERVVLIDAGTSEANGAIAGDIDPACAEKASVYTPVPGGVGPVTVACLMRNLVTLAG
ncbi:MAG TPA: bifunctional 5,10-methylenetetrahydrofolate dehydrogenase/5,10-methenyltetrahydrofolate cyclohydrolase [Candidatus Paceibacterota bacterium]|nr:bifunctional 5,10-methylenetetrahydrofolate dehydrogenase/5,10-methenyltetrahydrofolate cyclohydrolase [Candidatus Paceibacterota bacterium]